MQRHLEIDLLQSFVAIVDHGGFTAAAHALNRTQAAVSLQIKRLEEIAGIQLFKAPRRSVELTGEGAILLGHARRMLMLNEEALADVQGDRLSGRVRIGTISHYATHVLPPLLAEFSALHAAVEIELQTGLVHQMRERLGQRFDLIIGIGEVGGSGVPLARETTVWASSHRHRQHLRDPLPLALMPAGSIFRDWALAAMARQARAWRLAHESANSVATEAAVAAGLAVGLFTRSAVTMPGVDILSEADGFPALPDVEVKLEMAPGYVSRAAAKLRDFLIDRLGEPR